ncbi:MAG: hypothetical protein ACO22M_00650 [Candidatus Nanopelagicaceae bacterium]
MAQFIDASEEIKEPIASLEEQEQEPQQEATPVAEEEQDIPERYKGKTPKDLIRMHQEAEKLMGRHSKEVGELRRVVDDFIKTQTVTKQAPTEEEVDFFSDPQKAVEVAVSKHPKIKEAERMAAELAKQTALQQLNTAHPDYQDILEDSGFKEWVEKSKVRMELLSRADQRFDFDAADDLFTSWKERQALVKSTVETQKADRKQQVKQASTGNIKGSAESVSRKIYRRSDIIDLMRKDPQRYQDLQPEIMAAYAEGRVR